MKEEDLWTPWDPEMPDEYDSSKGVRGKHARRYAEGNTVVVLPHDSASMSSLRRIAFDLDETLGVPLVDNTQVIGWQARHGCLDLLERLRPQFALCLWSVSSRRYVEKALSFGLGRWFDDVYTWDEFPVSWKDVRRIDASLLVDDSPHHREAAAKYGLSSCYVVVPAFGCPADNTDPLQWVREVESAVLHVSS